MNSNLIIIPILITIGTFGSITYYFYSKYKKKKLKKAKKNYHNEEIAYMVDDIECPITSNSITISMYQQELIGQQFGFIISSNIQEVEDRFIFKYDTNCKDNLLFLELESDSKSPPIIRSYGNQLILSSIKANFSINISIKYEFNDIKVETNDNNIIVYNDNKLIFKLEPKVTYIGNEKKEDFYKFKFVI